MRWTSPLIADLVERLRLRILDPDDARCDGEPLRRRSGRYARQDLVVVGPERADPGQQVIGCGDDPDGVVAQVAAEPGHLAWIGARERRIGMNSVLIRGRLANRDLGPRVDTGQPA